VKLDLTHRRDSNGIFFDAVDARSYRACLRPHARVSERGAGRSVSCSGRPAAGECLGDDPVDRVVVSHAVAPSDSIVAESARQPHRRWQMKASSGQFFNRSDLAIRCASSSWPAVFTELPDTCTSVLWSLDRTRSKR
jgi:hypothetical protein